MDVASPEPPRTRPPRGWRLEGRALGIWVALVLLFLFSAIWAPDTLKRSAFLTMLPFMAFLATASLGQALVIMTRGIDLSVPSVITMVGTILIGASAGRDEGLALALAIALVLSMIVGLANGLLIAFLGLSPLVVTLAVGSLVTGGTLWYRTGIAQESRVPPALADWGTGTLGQVSYSVLVAVGLALLLTFGLRHTTFGRRFSAVGANPTAAWFAGIPVRSYQISAYTIAALLYGITGVMLSAFIRNPTLELGRPYLLAPIAAVVLGGTPLSGGQGSLMATVGGAIFLIHLGQVLRVMGLSTAFQNIFEGLAIALGMVLTNLQTAYLDWRTLRRMPARLLERPPWSAERPSRRERTLANGSRKGEEMSSRELER